MKKILGLDLGTNSIGWALVAQNFEKYEGGILAAGSRIIPMSQDVLGKFDAGQSISQTAERTNYRSVRKLQHRNKLRRERLHRVLNIMGFLPQHYAKDIDFNVHFGQFFPGKEPKLAYRTLTDKITLKLKHEFIFQDAFQEMVAEFKKRQPALFKSQKNDRELKIPYDWTIYYLRKKALTASITKGELAWIILNFNQKRGYYQLRGEEVEEQEGKEKAYEVLKVRELIDSGEVIRGSGDKLYNVVFENGWTYDKQTTKPEDWIDKEKEFIVTTSITKKGETKRTFKAVDSEQDWIAIKKKTEQEVDQSGKEIGEYIFDTLLENPSQKIRGKLIKTIERKYYKQELKRILSKQAGYHNEFSDRKLYAACMEELYPRNEAHRANISDKNLEYLISEDIIFYQRPLKSKKSTIADCQYETRKYHEDGIPKEQPLKAIPKSHPLFQESRLWQFIHNLEIYQKEAEADQKVAVDVIVTNEMFDSEDDWVELFDVLKTKKEIGQKNVIDFLIKKGKIKKVNADNYRWNFVEDKKYPAYDTISQFQTRLSKLTDIKLAADWLDEGKAYHLWHLVYSVNDKVEYEKALATYARKYNLPEADFVAAFKSFPPFKSQYGAYSEKALKKMVPLMRLGKYWKEENLNGQVLERIDKLLTGEYDEDISDRVRKHLKGKQSVTDFRGLQLSLVGYVVYNRHSEAKNATKWESPQAIDQYLKEFKQHQLRNPIVEQIVTETLRVVRDIWQIYGNAAKDFFDEIHIELGREMKNPAKKRQQMTNQNLEREKTNHRIKELLTELMNEGVEVRPYSPSHQEILKIYDEGVYQSQETVTDDIEKIRRNNSPSRNDIIRYKLWLEQGYISPYTGKVIPLNKLFSKDYQIEHIIPQSRFFDNSLGNKVICESAVNAEKGNQTAYEYIRQAGGSIVSLGSTENVRVLSLDNYVAHCSKYFKANRSKLKKLLSEDIPDSFIERQMNDTRYISSFIKNLLSNMVREENEVEVRSKNLTTIPGAITSILKKDWGLNDKWNELVAPRFQRLNEITKSEDFGHWDERINAFRCQVPDAISRGFNKKRIDHRHHELDAIVVACTTASHVNYISSLNTERNRHDLVSKLREREKVVVKGKERLVAKAYKLPWPGFPVEVKQYLETTVVSFKQNLRVINKTNNKTWQWVEENGALKKKLVPQQKGDSWAIRKPLHKDTVAGKVKLTRVKGTPVSLNTVLETPDIIVDKLIRDIVKTALKLYQGDLKKVKKHFKENPIQQADQAISKVEVYHQINATASRTALTETFTRKQLDKITDTGIQKILNNHVKNYTDEAGKERFDEAFSQTGLEVLNKNMLALNGGKHHAPIKKVRLYEEGSKFPVGTEGNKTSKYVEAAKGTNLFFAIYRNVEKGKRVFETVPLHEVIEHQKQTAHLPVNERTPIPLNPENGTFLFSLSPNDLVYVPTEEEQEKSRFVDFANLTKEQIQRVYKMVSSSGNQCFFIKNEVAKPIQNKYEYSALNKMEKSVNGLMIKECCWKLEVDRLGKVSKVYRTES